MKDKRDTHDKRRNFAEILFFIFIIFVFQCKSTEHMRKIKDKNNSH